VALDDAVQQCYRVSPGPDFVLVVHALNMPDYLALAQRLFSSDVNVRNVKAFFSTKRSKFGARLPMPPRSLKPIPSRPLAE
jgi:Lrp/AsnC family leucine-responsive transcriptional regulator